MEKAEQEAITKAQSGDIFAFTSLVRKYDKQVMQLAYNMVGNVEDAQDIYQEVFVRVYKKISGFTFRSEFSTWLYRVVINMCINFQKQRSRKKRMFAGEHRFDPVQRFSNTVADDGQTPEQVLLNHELADEIELALQALSAKQKAVFVMRHYNGTKIREIAEILKCSEGTIKNYLFRATQKMQAQLREYTTI
jgi:RNA polymerase sigma-70 factor (ECF subfamily)